MISHRYYYVKRASPHNATQPVVWQREGWYLFGFIPLYTRDC